MLGDSQEGPRPAAPSLAQAMPLPWSRAAVGMGTNTRAEGAPGAAAVSDVVLWASGRKQLLLLSERTC